jgi:hypothetical protein
VPRDVIRLVTMATVGLVLATGAPAEAETVSAKRWAKQACNAIDDWADRVDDALTFDDEAPLVDAATIRKSLLGLLKRAQKETRALLGDLDDAGTPRVTGGKDAATALRDSYEQVLTSVTDARRGVKAASTTDPAAFLLALDGALAAATTAVGEVATTFETEPALNTAPILKAFRSQRACKKLAAADAA